MRTLATSKAKAKKNTQNPNSSRLTPVPPYAATAQGVDVFAYAELGKENSISFAFLLVFLIDKFLQTQAFTDKISRGIIK